MSLMSQGLKRIDSHRVPTRDQTGRHSDEQQDCRYASERRQIKQVQSKKERPEKLSKDQRDADTNGNSETA